jgi:hypothetical protein
MLKSRLTEDTEDMRQIRKDIIHALMSTRWYMRFTLTDRLLFYGFCLGYMLAYRQIAPLDPDDPPVFEVKLSEGYARLKHNAKEKKQTVYILG